LGIGVFKIKEATDPMPPCSLGSGPSMITLTCLAIVSYQNIEYLTFLAQSIICFTPLGEFYSTREDESIKTNLFWKNCDFNQDLDNEEIVLPLEIPRLKKRKVVSCSGECRESGCISVKALTSRKTFRHNLEEISWF
jgi:hypothetical protein